MKQHTLQTIWSSTEETTQVEMPKSLDQSVNVVSKIIPQRKIAVVMRENHRQLNYHLRNKQKIKKQCKQKRIEKTEKKFKVDHIDMNTNSQDATQTIPKSSRQFVCYHKKKSEVLARKRERYAQNKKSKRMNAKQREMHSTQSRQMNYYTKNKAEILAKKREKHLMQKLKHFRPLQIPTKRLCSWKKSHKYPAFENLKLDNYNQ